MLKQVVKTFLKFFTIFILIIIAFTFCFCVVLKPPVDTTPSPWKLLRKEWKNYSVTTNNSAFNELKEPAVMFVNTLENALYDNNTIFRNFENPFTSFLKTLQMLSGEYTIDPYALDSTAKQIIFLIFVLTSFNLFNLINGLAISDIAILKEHAEFLSLKQQIRNASESESVLCHIFWKISGKSCKASSGDDVESNNANDEIQQSFWKRFILYLMSLLVRKYPYLHKIDNLCIDFKRKTVKYEIDQRRIHVLKTRSGDVGQYKLNKKPLKKLHGIVEKQHSQELSVNEQVETLHAEVKNMKITLRTQHDEMKKIIQEILVERKF